MGTEGMVESIETYLKEIDVPAPQVMIQVYLLELTHGSRGQLEHRGRNKQPVRRSREHLCRSTSKA